MVGILISELHELAIVVVIIHISEIFRQVQIVVILQWSNCFNYFYGDVEIKATIIRESL